jgi:hypothetical protein
VRRCRACGAETESEGRFCAQCGAELPADSTLETEFAPPSAAKPDTSSTARSSGLGGSRFAPGTILDGRYRIVGLIGKGGMGEVYRAEDLLLDQPVALKFLPEELANDSDRMQRLLGEVRLARQVSHPNVCRVYDIGEVDGHRFFTMELVEGEDLASLLKQVGRISGDKGIDIARQLCVGLAAAHERGVIHRDFKPANIMIDRGGRVRITDFGLALAEKGGSGGPVAGTPGYMAPEQLSGGEVTRRSDVWALGAVLYELFTGEKPFRGHSLAELRREQQESHVSSPSSHVEDLDPAVERVILRCLEHEPLHRPSSAAVAAALPGGNPLAVALAAGETPSPELVAAAGGEGSLAPRRALALAGIGLVVALVGSYVSSRSNVTNYYPLPKRPDVLRQESRDLLDKLGAAAARRDSASDWWTNSQVDQYITQQSKAVDRWDVLGSGRLPGLYFLYRQSPRYLRAHAGFTGVKPADPPLEVSGEARVELDSDGRLLSLDIVPPERDDESAEAAASQEVDWAPLFKAAGLAPADFQPTRPLWHPPYDVETRQAWTGEYPELPGVPIRIEAGAVADRPVYFRALGPWSQASRMVEDAGTAPASISTQQQRLSQWIFAALIALALFTSILLASRNLRFGRGDRRGALRLAFWFFVAHSIAWALFAHHSTSLPKEWNIARLDLGYNLFMAVLLWLLYIGLEPYVRKHWPETLIGWSRLLTGRFRDPRLGRDVLVGVIAGALSTLLGMHGVWLGPVLGVASSAPRGTLAAQSIVARVLDLAIHAVLPEALLVLLLLVLFLFLLRRRRLAVVGAGILISAILAVTSPHGGGIFLHLPFAILAASLWFYVLTRHGLVALATTFFVSDALFGMPLTTNLHAWYATDTWIVLLVLLGLIVYGYRVATAGRSLGFGELDVG